MQTDMHYCGTYVMARCAGIEADTARAIATAAEYVDDSGRLRVLLADGAALVSEPTAHHALDANNLAPIDQRRTWVPFHFIPGAGAGTSGDRRLLCQMDSEISKAMVERNIGLAGERFGIPLIGITAHVYADTFAHYGFAGISSKVNHVRYGSIDLDVSNKEQEQRLRQNHAAFKGKYIDGPLADMLCGLGHAGGATFPDQPYLRWRFTYADNDEDSGWRDNPSTFLLACRKLHAMFKAFNEATDGDYSDDSTKVEFGDIEESVRRILKVERDEDGRTATWNEAVVAGKLYPNPRSEPIPSYDNTRYLSDLRQLGSMTADQARQTMVYLFLEAANNHRAYVLNDLLPKHGLSVENSLAAWAKTQIRIAFARLTDKQEMTP